MIFYRICSLRQCNPSPIYNDDKWKLVYLCHESFLKAKTDEEVTYLLDRCPQWREYFSKHGKIIDYNAGSRDNSLTIMFDMAKEVKGKVLMLEDDYLWREGTLKYLWRGLDFFPLVSPYDHPAHYIEARFMDFPFKLKLIDNIVWRNSPSNTHTFGTTGEYIKSHWDVFREGCWDHIMFTNLLPDQVWNPTYSFATHMVIDWIAPNVDWSPYLKTSEE
jgi:hypothetical protein